MAARLGLSGKAIEHMVSKPSMVSVHDPKLLPFLDPIAPRNVIAKEGSWLSV